MKLCECGCGEPAPVSDRSRPEVGVKRGEPMRFIRGHQNRGRTKDNAAYSSLHEWLRNNFPKTGLCELCGKPPVPGRYSGTDYALKHGCSYTRNRADYLELCHACHMGYDNGGVRNTQSKLIEDQVREIRRRYTPGQGPNSLRSLAKEFGISIPTVHKVATKQAWKGVV